MFGNNAREKKETFDKKMREISRSQAAFEADDVASSGARIIVAYLKAVYSLSAKDLPMNRMGEEFFYDAQNLIRDRKKQGVSMTCSDAMVSSISLADYNSLAHYSVQSAVYDVMFKVKGAYARGTIQNAYSESRIGRFSFRNDYELGWILCGHKDMGSC